MNSGDIEVCALLTVTMDLFLERCVAVHWSFIYLFILHGIFKRF